MSSFTFPQHKRNQGKGGRRHEEKDSGAAGTNRRQEPSWAEGWLLCPKET